MTFDLERLLGFLHSPQAIPIITLGVSILLAVVAVGLGLGAGEKGGTRASKPGKSIYLAFAGFFAGFSIVAYVIILVQIGAGSYSLVVPTPVASGSASTPSIASAPAPTQAPAQPGASPNRPMATVPQAAPTLNASFTPLSTTMAATPAEAVAPDYDLTEEDYAGQSLNEQVAANRLVCVTTAQISVRTSQESLQFAGNGRGSAVCWIGPQFARADNLQGASLKHVSILRGDSEQIAVSLVRGWALEMTTQSDGCGSGYGPCRAMDLAVIRADGSVVRP